MIVSENSDSYGYETVYHMLLVGLSEGCCGSCAGCSRSAVAMFPSANSPLLAPSTNVTTEFSVQPFALQAAWEPV